MQRKQKSFEQALQRAEELCSMQEKCIADIQLKCKQWGLAEEDTKKIIQSLISHNFIDEERYSRAFIKDKIRFNKWGKNKIRHALYQKRIPETIIDNALEEIDEKNYSAMIYDELCKKMKSIKNTDEQGTKDKLIRFGISRGYDNGKVFDTVKLLTKNKF